MNGAMRSASVAMTPGVTAAYNSTQFPVIADIGVASASNWPLFLDASPASKGILFDKPHLRAELRHRSLPCVFCRNMNSNVSVELDPSERTNVRVIAATNRDLQAAIAACMFRSDVFLPAQRLSD